MKYLATYLCSTGLILGAHLHHCLIKRLVHWDRATYALIQQEEAREVVTPNPWRLRKEHKIGGNWYWLWYRFPYMKSSIYGVKTKHSFPAYSLASWLQNPLLAMETNGQGPGFIISSYSSLQVISRPNTGWWKSSNQQGHMLPLHYLKPQIKTLTFSFSGSLGFQR